MIEIKVMEIFILVNAGGSLNNRHVDLEMFDKNTDFNIRSGSAQEDNFSWNRTTDERESEEIVKYDIESRTLLISK